MISRTLVALIAFAGCVATGPEPVPTPRDSQAPAAPATPLSQGEAADACDAALAILGQTNEPPAQQPWERKSYDFNSDGNLDCVLSVHGALALYLSTQGEGERYQFVGKVQAGVDDRFSDPISCRKETVKGMCLITTSERMIHGEDQVRRYEFDGTAYRQTSVSLTSPEPMY